MMPRKKSNIYLAQVYIQQLLNYMIYKEVLRHIGTQSHFGKLSKYFLMKLSFLIYPKEERTTMYVFLLSMKLEKEK